nr:5507_t:CDS:2 [Entrophospora candida]CAG8561936.1 11688_t:CDS:2 [Entrophospora candida]
MTITLIYSSPEVISREQVQQHTLEPGILYPITHHVQNNVNVIISPNIHNPNIGKGSLWVTESKLYFYSWETNNGLAIDYPTIIIHAVSRQQAVDDGIGPCIYTQLNEKSISFGAVMANDQTLEMRFIPDDTGAQYMAALPSDEQELSELGRASLAYLDSIITHPQQSNNHQHQQSSSNPNNSDNSDNKDEEMFQDADE